jgi:hypothetical protein
MVEADEQVLNNLKRLGDSLTKPRRIDFSLLFDNKTRAQDFINVIPDHGYTVEEIPNTADQEDYPIILWVYGTPSVLFLEKHIAFLNILADKYDGAVEGWGTQALPDVEFQIGEE